MKLSFLLSVLALTVPALGAPTRRSRCRPPAAEPSSVTLTVVPSTTVAPVAQSESSLVPVPSPASASASPAPSPSPSPSPPASSSSVSLPENSLPTNNAAANNNNGGGNRGNNNNGGANNNNNNGGNNNNNNNDGGNVGGNGGGNNGGNTGGNNGGNTGGNNGGGNIGGNTGGNSGGDGGLASQLFPPGLSYSNGFTTANGVNIPGVSRAALSDDALNVRSSSGLGHPVVQQSGKTAWEAFYPRGSYKPSARPLGGFGFYAAGNNAFRNAINGGAREVVLGYSVMFENGFDFNMGGKLPGGFGGIGGAADGCSGGRQQDRNSCFSLRMMWRTNGQSELYTYLPDSSSNTNAQLRIPSSHRNPDFGFSVGRGLSRFPPGQWVTVSERIRLNDVGASNGEVEVRLNGQTVINVRGLTLRTSGESRHQGLHFQTFFGGGSPIWASAKDQRAWFADVSGAIVN